MVAGASLLFFAFSGFGKITTVSEEVQNPRKNVPLSIFISLAASFVIYLLVAALAVSPIGGGGLNGSEAYLARAIASHNIPFGMLVISIGAIAATASVLLTNVLGVSRVLYSMSKGKQAPSGFSVVNPRTLVPENAVLVGGVASAILVLSGNLNLIASISSFGLLAYYAIANFAALNLKAPKYTRLIPVLGVISCVSFMFFLSVQSITIGVLSLVACAIYYRFVLQG